MKFNLKNRPKPPSFPTIIMKYYGKMYEEWFEGFEKELREQLRKAQAEYDKLGAACAAESIRIIKEILGEK